MPVVDNEGNLRALTTRTDLKKQHAYPNSSKDKSGKLLVGAAVRAGARDEIDMERVLGLYKVRRRTTRALNNPTPNPTRNHAPNPN